MHRFLQHLACHLFSKSLSPAAQFNYWEKYKRGEGAEMCVKESCLWRLCVRLSHSLWVYLKVQWDFGEQRGHDHMSKTLWFPISTEEMCREQSSTTLRSFLCTGCNTAWAQSQLSRSVLSPSPFSLPWGQFHPSAILAPMRKSVPDPSFSKPIIPAPHRCSVWAGAGPLFLEAPCWALAGQPGTTLRAVGAGKGPRSLKDNVWLPRWGAGPGWSTTAHSTPALPFCFFSPLFLPLTFWAI